MNGIYDYIDYEGLNFDSDLYLREFYFLEIDSHVIILIELPI